MRKGFQLFRKLILVQVSVRAGWTQLCTYKTSISPLFPSLVYMFKTKDKKYKYAVHHHALYEFTCLSAVSAK